MQYKKVSAEDINYFRQVIDPAYILFDRSETIRFSQDQTEDLVCYPEVVLTPANTEEVAAIMAYCNTHMIPVTPRGAGTGLSGGALALMGGVLINMQRFKKIIEIDERNMQVNVEPGVVNEELQDAVREKGLFYPPDPASKGSCFLGGNVAHASGGPRALKYGTTRDYVLNLEVVLPSGEIIWTGANTLKYSTGYNLTHLMIGSEGTLGIVTKIVLKLIPHPQHTYLMLVPFNSPEKACEAVNGIFLKGYLPSACEFVEPEGFWLSADLLKMHFNRTDNVQAYLLIEVDGNNTELMMKDCEGIAEVCYAHESGDIVFAESAEEKEYLWKLRRTIGLATKYKNTYREEDTVVPRAELPVLFRGVKAIAEKYTFRTVCYGHAGDGNLHVNILKDQLSDEHWNTKVIEGIKEIFQLCKELKGTISGEHGIGLVQKPYMNIVMSEVNLNLMRNIKTAFDPNGILNPGKIF